MTLHRPFDGLRRGRRPGRRLTPEDAGWDWTGLRVLRLAPGRAAARARPAESRLFVLPLRGSLRVEVRGRARRARGEVRPARSRLASSARSPTSPTSAATASLTCTSDGGRRGGAAVVALRAAARRRRTAPPRTSRSRCAAPAGHPPGQQLRRARGLGPRREADLLRADHARPATGRATRRTSTTPREPCEVVNEEIYYYRIAGPDQVTPSRDGLRLPPHLHRPRARGGRARADRRDPRGPRPRRGAGPARLPRSVHGGARLPDVLPQRDGRARRDRALAFCDDPAHGWVRDTWAGVPTRPPLPGHLGGRARGRTGPSYDDDAEETMTDTIRLTTAQALVRWMIAQRSELLDGTEVPLFAGRLRDLRPRQRARPRHRAARGRATSCRPGAARTSRAWRWPRSAYARATDRRQVMAATTSIGPGALNMVTAAGVAHANRLPVLLLPGDTFAGRAPDPVLQQVEHFGDPTTIGERRVPCRSSRYFDRITRPEQLLALAAAGGPGAHRPRRRGPGRARAAAGRAGRGVRLPGGHVRAAACTGCRGRGPTATTSRAPPRSCAARSGRCWCSAAGCATPAPPPRRSPSPRRTAYRSSRPSPAARWCRTTTRCTAGRSASSAPTSANDLAAEADVVLAVGTRLQDFTTSSWTGFAADVRIVTVNAARFDAVKHSAPGRGRRRARERWSSSPRRWATGRRRRGLGRAGRAASWPTWDAARRPAARGRRARRLAHLRPGRRRRQRRQRPGGLRAHRVRRHAGRAARRLAHRQRHARRVADLGRDDGPRVRLLLHGLRGRRSVGRGDGPGAAPTRTGWSPSIFGDGSYLMLNSELYSAAFAGRPVRRGALRQRRLRGDPPAADRPGRRRVQQPARRLPRPRRRRRPARRLRRARPLARLPRRGRAPTADVEDLRSAYAARASAASPSSGRPSWSAASRSPTWTEAGAWWETGVPASLSGRAAYDEGKARQVRWL